MADFKFGDLICYRKLVPHETALMYVGHCGHNPRGLIDIVDVACIYIDPINHKDPSMWQRCTHLIPLPSELVMAR